jgi:SHS2 domain-containing protein
MPYELSDAHSTADVGLIATGGSPEELFADAAYGLMEIMVEPDGLEQSREITFELEEDDLKALFFAWLSEVIYYKDAESFLVKKCNLEIAENDKIRLTARLYGDEIDPQRHVLKTDVKAVTYYRYKFDKTDDQWLAEVVLDL